MLVEALRMSRRLKCHDCNDEIEYYVLLDDQVQCVKPCSRRTLDHARGGHDAQRADIDADNVS